MDVSLESTSSVVSPSKARKRVREKWMSSNVAKRKRMAEDPDFITYLLDQEVEHDCYFLVGNEEHTSPVKIGVVRRMLMAHSEVMRRELYESKLAEKDVISVTDLYPDTFKNLLKYVYGYDNIATLSFEDADNLLYAAEKYLMKRLKNKLAGHLIPLLNYTNVCTLMNNPVCFQHLQLDFAITKILQMKTNKIFERPQFLEMNSEVFLKILEQDALAIQEIEIWRAALKWAKHRVNSDDGAVLRQQLTPHLKHIRLCTLSSEELISEVVPTNVLKDSEFVLVCKSVNLKEKQEQLNEVCNTIDTRYNPTCFNANFTYTSIVNSKEATFSVLTEDYGIELLPFVFKANTNPNDTAPRSLSYEFSCFVTIAHINDSTDHHTVTPISCKERVMYDKQFFVPLTSNGLNIQLLPNSKYYIKVVFNVEHDMYCHNEKYKFDMGYFKVKYWRDTSSNNHITPIKQLKYRIRKV